ncbi:probable inactive purple acid phosphatase 16 isoform X2 [Momordica charantia]|uniref:Probable inactive purple acid phosphatase 16 isoform X2 n=1 Tax=Momordica charantia TaxID=3673 RepID=A0A6J1DQP1_MOMCH|nr:probable inactive purple acid phosphatase 16 isoform X2 [Momordica charantia]
MIPKFITLSLLICALFRRAAAARVLRMRPGSASFKIAVFADLHFGEEAWSDWGPIQDANSTVVISTVLHDENPDLVVYLGDVITANNIATPNAATFYWEMALSPAKARGIPWATVFGNHDDAPFSWPLQWFSSAGIPHQQKYCRLGSAGGGRGCEFRGTRRLELMKNEVENNSLSRSRSGPTDLWPTISNYYLQISPSDGLELSPVINLYFLDSGGGSYPEVISSSQVEWFRRTAQQINPYSEVAEIVFWHIPSGAYEEVAPYSLIEEPCVGSINKEKVAAQQAEFGIMTLLQQRPSVKAVFVGHNHGLDWCCPHKSKNKLWLCFARHSGYGGYGDWPRGARIIQITHKPFSLKSWIRMEDGQLHSQVILSS